MPARPCSLRSPTFISPQSRHPGAEEPRRMVEQLGRLLHSAISIVKRKIALCNLAPKNQPRRVIPAGSFRSRGQRRADLVIDGKAELGDRAIPEGVVALALALDGAACGPKPPFD